jgi:hypothetical protein
MNYRKHLLVAALVALCVAPPVALAAALPGRAKYVGTTSDDNAVTLKLTGDGSHIKRMRIHYTVTCNDGREGQTYTDILGARVRKDHTFSAKGTYTGSGDGSQNTFKASGKVWANTASGKFFLKATGTASDGTALSCKTARLTWSAKRQK